MKRFFSLLALLITLSTGKTFAKFVQELELRDGTDLVGYVYRQQPGSFIEFYAERAKKDPKSKYTQRDKSYTLQWKDVKYIRRSAESDAPWCYDKVTLKNGTTYEGQIEEQEVGVSMTIRLQESGKSVKVSNNDLQTIEKTTAGTGRDLWADRQYTNRLKLTDNSIHDGVIVLQYRGEHTEDCYVELLHGTGFRERLFLPDISEYIMLAE